MEEARTQSGLIGFFDILGYQSFLENNDVEIGASEVLKTITNIDSIINRKLIISFEYSDEKFKQILDNIRWLVFSDTILMAMEWDGTSLYEWVVFTCAEISLSRHMFDFGLPLRGAIKNGSYVISKSCFAGRVIVDAYHAERSINLAACSVDAGLINSLKKMVKDTFMKEVIDRMTVDYATPLVDGGYKKMSLLNYLLVPTYDPAYLPQLVLNSFWKHGKDITGSAETKAKNTENFLRFLSHRFPDDLRA